ncbi:hypothetical protein [Vallitalea okinawensis]|uniref:hypothetical protein n=1 Tax=Vallitalea okinawensis TaxID=2078660 RepID=UPI000CFD0C05|nr:hypothetical protein [Vallitalea okinawensis]
MFNPNYWNLYYGTNPKKRKKHEENKEFHSPQYLLSQLQPVVDYGLQESNDSGLCQGMMEVAIVAYLMGRGYDCETAQDIIKFWEKNEVFKFE